MTDAIKVSGMPHAFLAEDGSILQFLFARADGGDSIRLEMSADVFIAELAKLNQMGAALTMKTGTTSGHYTVVSSPVRRMMADTPVGATNVVLGIRTDTQNMHFAASPDECAELRRQLKAAIEKARRNQKISYS